MTAAPSAPRPGLLPANWLRGVADGVLALIFSPECASCGQSLERPTDGAVCAACWRSILPLTPPLCDACGDPLPTWRQASVPTARCPRCRRLPRAIARARAVGVYDGALRSIIHALKYGGRRSLARPLGNLMRERGSAVLGGTDFVVPVPLHSSRRRTRGFNQAADLANHVGLPSVSALRRIRATAAQAGLPASRRHANVRGAFAVRRQATMLQDAVVTLIDDVTTTGATLDSCARALVSAGVREVRALTAARVSTSAR